MWAVGVCLTNSYVLYKRYCEVHRLPQRFTHYEWVCEIGKAWLHPDQYFKIISPRDGMSVTSVLSSTSTSTAARGTKRRSSRIAEAEPKRGKSIAFTDATLSSDSKCFIVRRDRTKMHWPSLPDKTRSEPRCQLHTWASRSQIRKKAGVVRCETCGVHLCIECFNIFHEVPNLVEMKEKLCNKMTNEDKNKK